MQCPVFICHNKGTAHFTSSTLLIWDQLHFQTQSFYILNCPLVSFNRICNPLKLATAPQSTRSPGQCRIKQPFPCRQVSSIYIYIYIYPQFFQFFSFFFSFVFEPKAKSSCINIAGIASSSGHQKCALGAFLSYVHEHSRHGRNLSLQQGTQLDSTSISTGANCVVSSSAISSSHKGKNGNLPAGGKQCTWRSDSFRPAHFDSSEVASNNPNKANLGRMSPHNHSH